MIRTFPYTMFLLFVAWAAFAFEAVDHTTYFGTTEKLITMSWDDQAAAEYFEVALFHVEHGFEVPAGSGRTETNDITFQLPGSGHYIAKIRACNDDLPDPCSDWTETTDATRCLVDGKPKGFWIYGYVAPPGDIVINEGP